MPPSRPRAQLKPPPADLLAELVRAEARGYTPVLSGSADLRRNLQIPLELTEVREVHLTARDGDQGRRERPVRGCRGDRRLAECLNHERTGHVVVGVVEERGMAPVNDQRVTPLATSRIDWIADHHVAPIEPSNELGV